MAGFSRAERQAIIDGYLAATGRNAFLPSEFIDWLEGQPDHPAHPWFFGKSDQEAAREYRIGLARTMASGLRISAPVSVTPAEPKSVSVAVVRNFPALISPVAARRVGGGYQPFDPHDAGDRAELMRQGATALRAWLERYGAVFEGEGEDLAPLIALADRHVTRRDAAS